MFDTNVLVSALLFPGSVTKQALHRALEIGFLLISDETFVEVAAVLRRPKFDAYVSTSERSIFTNMLFSDSVHIEIAEQVRQSIDPKDDKFLELALAGRADYLVTGDLKHLRRLDSFRGTRIVTARELLGLI